MTDYEPEKKILRSIQLFCSARERSAWETEEKLIRMKISRVDAGSYLRLLREEGFLDDARFTRQLIDTSLFQKNWGKMKVRQVLENHHIDAAMTESMLSEIPEESYKEMFQRLVDQNRHKKNLYLYLLNRGFEEELIEEHLSRII